MQTHDDGLNPFTHKPYTPSEAQAMLKGGLPALRKEMERKAKECPYCEGVGVYYDDQDGSGDELLDCESCDGTGYL